MTDLNLRFFLYYNAPGKMNTAENKKSVSSPTPKVEENGNLMRVLMSKTQIPEIGPYANEAMNTGISSK